MRLPNPGNSGTSFFAEWTRENAARSFADLPLRARRGIAGAAAVALVAAGGIALLTGGTASADPSPDAWYRLRVCESGNNYAIDTGNDHYGAYQFDVPTWQSVGGRGYPNKAGRAEQDLRALILYRERGWQPWQCASILGLHEDADARSGRTSDLHLPTSTSSSGGGTTSTALHIPAFPGGSHWYTYGETSAHIKTFQGQMHKRGFFRWSGTGKYGTNTLRMVKQLQRLNGLVPNGYIGPNTWRLAWAGRYTASPTASAPRIPAFPGGSHWYTYGENNAHIKTFQDEMHKRGYFAVGTGQYGPNTLRMVKQLQRLNGLVPNGYIGPNTWKSAWVGKYRTP
jgi:peptidoglycan hydrolase-like protein with peptidoglycan-binding domain